MLKNATAQTAGAVGQTCSAVVRGYPFDRRSQQDAFPQDFAQVFGPSGALKQAFDQIASAVDKSRNPSAKAGPEGGRRAARRLATIHAGRGDSRDFLPAVAALQGLNWMSG